MYEDKVRSLTPNLFSLNEGVPWAAGKRMEATCNRPVTLPDDMRWTILYETHAHVAPHENCTCGLYAVTYPERAPVAEILGRVNLWGKIVPGTDGYRAQYGYPKDLYVMERGGKAKELQQVCDELEKAYGVPARPVASAIEAQGYADAADRLAAPTETDFVPRTWL